MPIKIAMKIVPEKSQLRQSYWSSVCSIFVWVIPPAVRPTLLRQMGMGSLTCAQFWARAVRMKGGSS